LTLDEDKAATFCRVFELKESFPDTTLQKIANTLNAEGHTTKEGKQFYPMQVHRILDRTAFYEGIYMYSGIES
jgi:site-specific DNA recombinase